MIINRHKILCLSIAVFLVLLWVNTGCPKETPESHQPDAQKQSAQSAERSKDPIAPVQSFSQYLKEFSVAMKARDWSRLAGYSKFPVLFRGELDGEGNVLVERSFFLSFIESFLNEEIFIVRDHKPVSTTYFEVIAHAAANPPVENGTVVEIEGLFFTLNNGEWKLVKVYTQYIDDIVRLKEKQ